MWKGARRCNMSNDKKILTDADACYEAVASQEEIYLEERRKNYARSLCPTTYLHKMQQLNADAGNAKN